MKNLLILYDYRGFFSTKFEGIAEKHVGTTMDVVTLKKKFEEFGINVHTSEMSQVDFNQSYNGWYVIYASSEDQGLFYKDFIEDILLALQRDGAILVPQFDYFRSHCNKSYQELVRKQFKNESLKHPYAYSIGEISELNHIKEKISYPIVLKISYGSGSRGVVLVKDEKELFDATTRLMTHKYYDFGRTHFVRFALFLRRLERRINGRRIQNEPLFFSLKTNKLIIEEFIPELSGDYKVLVFGGKYFVLRRKNRKNDFRASGSGNFIFPDSVDEIKNVLALAEECVNEIGMPVMSLDIAENKMDTYLLEFQCVFFGPYALQYAPHCFIKKGVYWEKRPGSFDLEQEYARSVSEYIML